MNLLNTLFLILHIAAGFSALAVGVVPLVVKKGSPLHNRSGLVFYYAMAVVCATAFWLVAFKGSPLFLLFIAIFSFYMCFTGRREILRNRLRVHVERLDYNAAGLALLSAVGMLTLGIFQLSQSNFGIPSILYLVFGTVLFSQSSYDWRRFKNAAKSKYLKKSWFFHHITRMGGAYIAAFTAFAVVNTRFNEGPYAFWLNLVAWLAPGVIGGILIGRTVKYYLNKQSSSKGHKTAIPA
ncbi:DUF2306 domain-containing protein [Telluribacter sp.]|jgi:uncharacterized membrane protein|uniref:DUF2306 domain-containing protein n=1 Tax=Telluribacter sp. TaxID=1978767 RepID=UPI002E15EB03|nr:DUF2306 domain-containing protein [Telluribacter sp.]